MAESSLFENRRQAGELLARRLGAYAGRRDVVVLALPRGGVPVGAAVAEALGAPLDILLVRKLGVPGHEEYAMGAVADGGLCVLRPDVVEALGIAPELIESMVRGKLREIARRAKLYRAGRRALPLRGRVVVLVDDGLATGATMLAAVHVLRQREPARVVVAVPVAAADSCRAVRAEVDETICLATPVPFYSVGQWYEHFGQTSDDEVVALLDQAGRGRTPRPAGRSGKQGGEDDAGKPARKHQHPG